MKFSLLLLVLAIILTFATGIVPVNDYDFFWHLKTGEWIWQNRSLPDKDPFSFTSLPADSAEPHRSQTILKSYWLSQLFFYGIYSLSGFKGIIIFRALVFCIILIILWQTMGKDGIDYRLRIILLIPYIFIIREYQKERPQLFSFLFAPVVLYLLEDLKKSSSSLNSFSSFKSHFNLFNLLKLFKLPLVMVIWANMHGGFLVGVAFIVVYLGAEGIKRLKRSKRVNRVNETFETSGTFLTFFIICLISILISFVNPNTYHTITSFLMLYQSMLPDVTFEFLSPLKACARLSHNWYSYWFLLILAFLALAIRFRKFNLTELFILTGTAVASLSAIRYVFFFFIAAIPIIARHVNLGKMGRFFFLTADNNEGKAKKRTVPFSLLLLFLVLLYKSPLKSMPLKEDVYQNMFPVEAASFLEHNNLPGLMFNDATWGGYLIWRLYPKYKVFIDPRTLNIEIFKQYYSVLDASHVVYAGLPEWKGILNSYGINIILTPLTDRYSGEILPFIRELMRDDEWALVYIDNKTSIFLRKTQETEGFIRKYYFDKATVWREIIMRGRQ